MNSVSSWTAAVCVSVIAGGVIIYLIPNGTLKKCAVGAVTLFSAVAFFSPLVSGGAELDFDINSVTVPDTSELSESIDKAVIEYVEAELVNELVASAQKLGIRLTDVSIKTDCRDIDNVTVSEIKIGCVLTKAQKQEVKGLVLELFGEEAEIIFEN